MISTPFLVVVSAGFMDATGDGAGALVTAGLDGDGFENLANLDMMLSRSDIAISALCALLSSDDDMEKRPNSARSYWTGPAALLRPPMQMSGSFQGYARSGWQPNDTLLVP